MLRENMYDRRGSAAWLAAALIGVGGVIAGVSVAAASERAADVTVNALSSNAWDKPAVSVQTGDTVTWNLNSGNFLPHNVEATGGPAEDANWAGFNTTPKAEGTEEFTFTQPGTYTYLCRVHFEAMRGTVTVTGAPVTPTATRTPTPSATPSATRTPTPAPPMADNRVTPPPTRAASGDTTAPVISGYGLKAVTRGARVSFALSEPASVTIRVKRGKTVKRTVRLAARAGKRTVTVRGASLVRARYVVEIEARDARGNRAAVQRKNVRVTR